MEIIADASIDNRSSDILSEFTKTCRGCWQKFNQTEIVDKDNIVRKYLKFLVQHIYFQRLTLTVILANASIIAIADYSHVDEYNNLIAEGSLRNTILSGSDLFFTSYFIVECVFKVIALGFIGNSPAYLSDPWNVLDFVVVIAGIIALDPSMPNVKIIRSFRILRPLKTISQFPELAKLITSLMNSLAGLADVLKVIVTIFFVFGIIGLQTFCGPHMHAICRLTPYPVTKNWTVGMEFEHYRCLDEPNLDTLTMVAKEGWDYDKATSPWSEPQEHCHWPVDLEEQEHGYLCSLDGQGFHHCYHGFETLPEEEWRWCGSDFDAWGNYRFVREFPTVFDYSVYKESLNFGLYNFDHIGNAFFYVFQVMSKVNWWLNMYALMDATNAPFAAIYTILLLFSGTFVVFQLIIATLEKSVMEVSKKSVDELMADGAEVVQGDEKGDSYLMTSLRSFVDTCDRNTIWWRSYLITLVDSKTYGAFVNCLIVFNTIVLALDHYPESDRLVETVDAINFMLTLCFGVDCIVKMVAYGAIAYVLDPSNLFDGLIVAVSLADLITSPVPVLFSHKVVAAKSGNLSALRSFRLLRLLRLFRAGPLKLLFAKVTKCLIAVSNFAILVFLYLFVFTLIGMQFFANKMRFSEEGFLITEINSEEFINAPDRPRYNFDDFTHSLVSIFQTIALTEWNVLIFNCYRASGAMGAMFPIISMIIGKCILFNMLVALLIEGFMEEDEEEEEEEHEHEHKHELLDTEEVKIEEENVQNKLAGFYEPLKAPKAPKEFEYLNAAGDWVKVLEGDSALQFYTKEDVISWTESIQAAANEALLSSAAIDGVDGVVTAGKADLAVAVIRGGASAIRAGGADGTSTVVGGDIDGTGDGVTVPSDELNGTFADKESDSAVSASQSKLAFTYQYLQSQVELFVTHDYFEAVIMAIIFISCVTLAINTPLLDPQSHLVTVLGRIDVFMAVAFFSEMVLKMFAFGLVYGKNTYFMDPWNWLDCLIAITSVVTVSPIHGGAVHQLTSLRALRALRPLKLVNKLPALKQTVNALISSIPELGGVSLIFVLIHFIFAIFLVGFFRGQLRSCHGEVFDSVIKLDKAAMTILEYPRLWSEMTDYEKGWFGPESPAFEVRSSMGAEALHYRRLDEGDTMHEHLNMTEITHEHLNPTVSCTMGTLEWPEIPCTAYERHLVDYMDSDQPTSRMICELWGGEWLPFHVRLWDSVPQAMVNLFQLATEDGWVLQMYASVDCRGIDMQPIRDYNMAWAYFFILFMMFGSFFAVELFVGALSESFYKNSKKDGSNVFMTPDQIEWVKTKKMIMRIKPLPVLFHPPGYLSEKFFYFCQHPYFEIAIITLVSLQILLLVMESFGQDDQITFAILILNAIIGISFFIEFIIKVVAFGVKGYFRIGRNQYEFVVAVGSMVGVIVGFLDASNPAAMVGKIVRILRAVRLLQMESQALRDMFAVIIIALPGVINVMLLFILVLFIFTVIGVQLFAKTGYNGLLEIHANFRNFGLAFLTLARFIAGEGWDDYMYDAAEILPGCAHDPEYDPAMCGFNDFPGCEPLNGCGKFAMFPYLIVFTMIGTFVLLNLLIGVVLAEFDDVDSFELKSDDLQRVADLWSKYDPDANYFIDEAQLDLFVAELFSPLGFGGGKYSARQMNRRIGKVKVHTDSKVLFSDVIFSISTAYYERRTLRQKMLAAESSLSKVPSFLLREQAKQAAEVKNTQAKEVLIQGYPATLRDVYYIKRVQKAWKKTVQNRRAERAARNNRPKQTIVCAVDPAAIKGDVWKDLTNALLKYFN